MIKNFFFLVTATPQLEIEEILLSLNIKYFFKEIIGAPMEKYNAINRILKKHALVPENSVMIGDSSSDYSAAKLNGVPFILRKTSTNKILQKQLSCLTIKNFL